VRWVKRLLLIVLAAAAVEVVSEIEASREWWAERRAARMEPIGTESQWADPAWKAFGRVNYDIAAINCSASAPCTLTGPDIETNGGDTDE
jgi:hypothetical protein